MNKSEINKCPYCGSSNIGIGYHLGNGQLFVDPYAYHSKSQSSEIETYLCKDCGCIVMQKVKRPEIFDNINNVRNLELLDYFEENGFLLMNEHPTLPSIESLGYNMQNLVYLIENHQIFYTKAFGKRPIYLSIKCYQLLKQIKNIKPLSEDNKLVYNELSKYEYADKSDIRKRLEMDTKSFNKAFEFLLENLYITACAGKKLNANWYSYLYCTIDTFNKNINGLHFNGDCKEALWNIVKKTMDKESFEILCK